MFSAYLLGLTYLFAVFKSIQPASDVFPITLPLFNFISHPCAAAAAATIAAASAAAAVCFALDIFYVIEFHSILNIHVLFMALIEFFFSPF